MVKCATEVAPLCMGPLYKVVHNIGLLQKFNRAHRIEFKSVTASNISMKLGTFVHHAHAYKILPHVFRFLLGDLGIISNSPPPPPPPSNSLLSSPYQETSSWSLFDLRFWMLCKHVCRILILPIVKSCLARHCYTRWHNDCTNECENGEGNSRYDFHCWKAWHPGAQRNIQDQNQKTREKRRSFNLSAQWGSWKKKKFNRIRVYTILLLDPVKILLTGRST